MTPIIKVNKDEETRLWKILSERDSEDARSLSANVLSLCGEAADRMKAMYAYAPQYTLHDDRHLLRTTELMGLILGSEVQQLNDAELALLILSAFFHDQGMVLSDDEFQSLEADEDFKLFRDNWIVDHPNYSETAAEINSPHCAEAHKANLSKKLAELNAAMLIDYIRETHGERSAEFVRSTYGSDKRLEIQNVNLAPFLANLCRSHMLPCEALTSMKSFRYDEQIGTYTVNLPFLAVVLRIADILDFDRDRTPEVLLRSIHFTSPVSLFEWEKHRSVEGWQIAPNQIRFTARCKHPVYEAAVRRYMDWIDRELADCIEVCKLQPRDTVGYNLDLPTHVDRSRIEPLDNAYRYHDLEFSLSRDEVVRLLMTDKLYEGEYLCIRELLQNSLDALRYRKALFSEAGVLWDGGRVGFRHYINSDGYEVLECNDNGSGMDEEIIQNHFVKVGRSFYRSPFFERERNRLKASGKDFDPCSQFGIGFMSCFMLGDRITILTRRDYGHGRGWGIPLVIEIHGLSGLFVVREGSPEQPIGTTVSIIMRKKPSLLDVFTDKVRLCEVLKGYALATEYPITARCEVPELKEGVHIPTNYEITPTWLEIAQVQNCMYLHQDLSQVSPFLSGFVRESFLTDDAGLPCLTNFEAEWRGKTKGTSKYWTLYILSAGQEVDFHHPDFHRLDFGMRVCIDGILIAGVPGRPSYLKDSFLRLGFYGSPLHSSSPALINACGNLKPEITPRRTPPDRFGSDLPPGWKRLNEAFKRGHGSLWGQLIDYIPRGLSPETFWKLTSIHNASVGWIPNNKLWKMLSVSLTNDDHDIQWRLVRDLGEMSLCHSDENGFILIDQQGWRVGPNSELEDWERQGEERLHLGWNMNSIALLMSCLDIRDKKVIVRPLPPSQSGVSLAQYAEYSAVGVQLFLIEYVGSVSDALAVQTPYPTANRNHPLVKLYHQSRFANEPTDLQLFARSFVPCISKTLSTMKQTPSLDEPNYWQKRVGHLYFSVQWDRYDVSLRPPYTLWTEDREYFSFDEKDFARWRDSPACVK